MGFVTYISLTDDTLVADQSTESNLMGFAWRNCGTWTCLVPLCMKCNQQYPQESWRGLLNYFFFFFLCFFILFRDSVNVPKTCLTLLCNLTANSSLVGKSVMWFYRRRSVLADIAIDVSFSIQYMDWIQIKEFVNVGTFLYPFIKFILNLYKSTRPK
jgi:hypothetical protein